jgi:hypothetical protein
VHLVASNASTTQPIVASTPIEFAFDRLLLPASITRQTFQFTDSLGNQPTDASGQPIALSPDYDPVARVVRLCGTDKVPPDNVYRITIATTGGAALRAIDGAGLDPSQSNVIEFQVSSGPPYTGVDACSVRTTVDFCNDVLPIFVNSCSGSSCHAPGQEVLPAAGLLLTSEADIRATALNRVAQGANTGSRSVPAPALAQPPFGVDMPIIDTVNGPMDSWLVYKLLLGVACGNPLQVACDAGAPGVQRHAVLWSVLSPTEVATLSDFVLGREMPFPVDAGAAPGTSPNVLTADQMETISLWILQGASVPNCTP